MVTFAVGFAFWCDCSGLGELRSSPDRGFYPVDQAAKIDRARALLDDLSSPQDHQRRNAADAEARGDLGFVLGVELGDPDRWFKSPGRRVDHRGHGLARTAPRRPEINQDGQVGVIDVTVEIAGGERQRRADEQALFAPAAARPVGDAVEVNTVGRGAMRADNLSSLVHGGLLAAAER